MRLEPQVLSGGNDGLALPTRTAGENRENSHDLCMDVRYHRNIDHPMLLVWVTAMRLGHLPDALQSSHS